MNPRVRIAFAHVLYALAINAAYPLLWATAQSEGPIAGIRDAILRTSLVVNVVSFLLIRIAARWFGWNRREAVVSVADIVTSLPVLALPNLEWMKDLGGGVRIIVVVFVLFLSAKLLLLVSWAIANARDARERDIRLWIGCVSFLVYAALTPWIARSSWPVGDEPHYLLAAHSLVVDGDFDLSNNYRERDYAKFSPVELQDRHVWYNRRGEDVPVHDVGLSVLIAPGYAAGGWRGAMFEMNLWAAVLAVGLYALARHLGAGPRGALLVWGVFAFVSPLIVYSSQIYPETIGSACALWGALAFLSHRRTGSLAALISAGAFFSVLPWLSVRFWVIGGVLVAGFGLHLLLRRPDGPFRRWIYPVAFATPILIGLAALVMFDLRWYQSWLPNAGYFQFLASPARNVFTLEVHRGALGLLFDRASGLIPTAPVFLLAAAGIARHAKGIGWGRATLLAASAAYFLFGAANEYWYGGWAPPSRYLVPALVLVGPFAAAALASIAGRLIAVVLAGWSAVVAIGYTVAPWARYNGSAERAALAGLLTPYGLADFDRAFPSLARASGADYALAALWVAACAATVWLLARAAAPTKDSTAARKRDGSTAARLSC